jgi:hypothetical protein
MRKETAMHRVATTAVLLIVLFASPVLAGEFEDKFHKAYAQEVVEGDVKGAAAVYLDLMGETDAPAAIRAEAKFRFAVCTVLLGRADEARVHLAELIVAKDTPKDLRIRAEEYRDAVSGIGIGTELEKKLQTLVFDLGRESPLGNVAAYRDFEIIGKRSVPFLRKLLHHTDKNLRTHAWRMLCRMDEPGMAEDWKPEYGLYGVPFCQDVTNYLKARPEELAVFEKRLLGFGDKSIAMLANMQPKPPFSLEFVTTLAKGEMHRKLAFNILYNAGEKEARYAQVREWILSDDADLSTRASNWLVPAPQEKYATDELFPIVVRRIMEQGITFQKHGMDSRKNGLKGWCWRMPLPLLLSTLEELVAAGENWEKKALVNPLGTGLADELAYGLDGRLEDETELSRYLSLLERWATVELARNADLRKRGYNHGAHPRQGLMSHFRSVLGKLPEKQESAFLASIVTGEAKDRIDKTGWKDLLEVYDSRDVRILGAAIKAATQKDRRILVQMLPYTRGIAGRSEEDLNREQAKAVLDLAPTIEFRALDTLMKRYAELACALPVVEARKNLSELLQRALTENADSRRVIMKMSYGGYSFPPGFLFERVMPVVAGVWDRLSADEKSAHLYGFLRLIEEYRRGNRVEPDGARDALAAFIRARYTDLGANLFRTLIGYPELFPPEQWIPKAPENANFVQFRIPQETTDRISRALGKDLATLNGPGMSLINRASIEIRREIYTRGLAVKDRRVRQLFVDRISPTTGHPVTVETLENTLAAVLAEEDPDLHELSKLANIVLSLRPSKKLFPAASKLLTSGDRDAILVGIRIAGALGREDLVPDLSKLLDSMDQGIRTAAKKAIDSINDLARLKREAILKEKGVIPK